MFGVRKAFLPGLNSAYQPVIIVLINKPKKPYKVAINLFLDLPDYQLNKFKLSVQDRKAREKQQRHDAILEAASKILETNGLYNLNMNLVAEKTHLSKGTLYLYFKSKEEILAALSIRSRTLLLDRFKRAAHKSDDAIEQLKAIVKATFAFHKKYPFHYELISIYEVDDKLEDTEEIQSSVNNLMSFTTSLVEKGRQQGKIRQDIHPQQMAFCLWGILIGMSHLFKVRMDGASNELGITEQDVTATLLALVENGVKK